MECIIIGRFVFKLHFEKVKKNKNNDKKMLSANLMHPFNTLTWATPP
jgi:hypothetical protein